MFWVVISLGGHFDSLNGHFDSLGGHVDCLSGHFDCSATVKCDGCFLCHWPLAL